MVSSVFAAFLVTGREYSPAARLFPDLVSTAGWRFVVWRIGATLRHVSLGDLSWLRETRLWEGRMSWQWSLVLMGGFVVSQYVLGFVVGSVVYVTLVIVLSGDRRWGRALLIGSVTAACMCVLARIVHLQLPLGYLEFIR